MRSISQIVRDESPQRITEGHYTSGWICGTRPGTNSCAADLALPLISGAHSCSTVSPG